MGSKQGIAVQSPWQDSDHARAPAADGDGVAAEAKAAAEPGAGTLFSFCVDVEEVKDEPFSPRLLVQPIAATELVPVLSKSQVQADSGKLHAERCTPAQPVESGGRKVAPVLAPCDEPTTQCQPVKVTVVVVDDELLNRMVLITKLKQSEGAIHKLVCEGREGEGREGWEREPFSMDIVQAEHAESALALMRGKFEEHSQQDCMEAAGAIRHVHIILLDEHMESSGGVLKGSESIGHFRRLAEKHGCAQPVVVVSSGNCTKQDTKLYLKEGSDAVWPKPYPNGEQIAADCATWICSRLDLSKLDLDSRGLRGPCGVVVGDSVVTSFTSGADGNV